MLTLAFLHYPPPLPVVHYPFFAILFLFRLSGKSLPCVSSSNPYFTIVYSITLVTKARHGSDTLEKPFTFQPVNLSNALAGPEADVNASGDYGHKVELEYPCYGASPICLLCLLHQTSLLHYKDNTYCLWTGTFLVTLLSPKRPALRNLVKLRQIHIHPLSSTFKEHTPPYTTCTPFSIPLPRPTHEELEH